MEPQPIVTAWAAGRWRAPAPGRAGLARQVVRPDSRRTHRRWVARTARRGVAPLTVRPEVAPAKARPVAPQPAPQANRQRGHSGSHSSQSTRPRPGLRKAAKRGELGVSWSTPVDHRGFKIAGGSRLPSRAARNRLAENPAEPHLRVYQAQPSANITHKRSLAGRFGPLAGSRSAYPTGTGAGPRRAARGGHSGSFAIHC